VPELSNGTFPMTCSDPKPRCQSHRVTIDALDVLCVQLMCDLFATAKLSSY